MAESSYSSSSAGGQTERPKSEVINEKFDKMVKFASTSLTRAKQVKQGSKYTRIVLYCINLYYGAYSTYMLHAPCLSFGYNARMSRDCTLHPLCNALHIAYMHVVATPLLSHQFTVEKLGRADSVTSYGEDYDDLSQQIDHIKLTTERIVTNVQAMVEPNPGILFMTINCYICINSLCSLVFIQVSDWRLRSTLS